MHRFVRTLTKLFVALSIAFGTIPRAVALLDLMRRPSVRMTVITRRRRLDYADFFTVRDVEGRRHAPIVQRPIHRDGERGSAGAAAQEPAARTYTPVRSA